MNFLAHLYLSGKNSDLIIGNFIADHVKGNKIKDYNAGIQAGISLHRFIDHFTDNHEIVRASVDRIRPSFHKYAGVVVDMYFDHFLSSQWADWSDEPLKDFTTRMYSIIMSYNSVLPLRTRQMIPYMEAHDWLGNYGNFEGLSRAFNGMARRTPFKSNMESAADILQGDYNFYNNSFRLFFPELILNTDKMREQVLVATGKREQDK